MARDLHFQRVMRRILAAQHRLVLEQFAWSNVLVALDFDGTLAPIVDDPERAAMRTATRRRLADLAALYPCVVISGRAQVDARARLDGVAVAEVIGNHGIEPWQGSDHFVNEVAGWRVALGAHLDGIPGVVIEDKRYSVAVHYRHAREKRRARDAIAVATAALGDVRVVGGKQVVNLIPRGAPDKGVALEHARERAGCDTAIYIGDDDSDEDVFRLDQPGRLLTIRVGAQRSSQADYCVRDQREIDTLLEALIGMRAQRRRQRA